MRILTNICSDDLQKSKEFYVELLGFNVKYDSDWYVQLCSPEDSEIEYGIIQRNHDLVPRDYQKPPTGMYVTFVVKDVDATYQTALTMGLPILQEPRNEFYGQRRFLVKDPNGCLIDICSPWESE
ncbi:VOC family protein [Enterovibrio sp. FF113]|uniref:VOC family protein n=1 Tax=Enterovibrio sp. FF113 TaxID=3230010 RepID=UPI00352DD4B5